MNQTPCDCECHDILNNYHQTYSQLPFYTDISLQQLKRKPMKEEAFKGLSSPLRFLSPLSASKLREHAKAFLFSILPSHHEGSHSSDQPVMMLCNLI